MEFKAICCTGWPNFFLVAQIKLTICRKGCMTASATSFNSFGPMSSGSAALLFFNLVITLSNSSISTLQAHKTYYWVSNDYNNFDNCYHFWGNWHESLVQNYCPVSLLSLFHKILERLMADWLTKFVTTNSVLID